MEQFREPATQWMLIRAAAFVLMPVWASFVLLLGAHVVMGSPEPLPPPSSSGRKEEPAPSPAPAREPAPLPPLRGNETVVELRERLRDALREAKESRNATESVRRELAAARAKSAIDLHRLHRAQRESAEAHERTRDMEDTLSSNLGFFGSLAQGSRDFYAKAAAVAFGMLGLLTVLGPMTFVQVYKTTAGSALGGLVVAGCVGFFRVPDSAGWLDEAIVLLKGHGPSAGYAIWVLMVAVGVLRWYLGWDWVLYAVVDDVYMSGPTANACLSTPLLSECKPAEEESVAPAAGAEDGRRPLVARSSVATSGSAAGEAMAPETTETPSMYGGSRARVDDESSLERLMQTVRWYGHDMPAEARNSTHWFLNFWAEVAAVLHETEASEEIVEMLRRHGFRPDDPVEASAPSLMYLHQDLQELQARVARVSTLAPGSQARSGAESGAPAVDEV